MDFFRYLRFGHIVSRNKRIHHKTAQNLQTHVRLFQLNETCVKIAKLFHQDLCPAADHVKNTFGTHSDYAMLDSYMCQLHTKLKILF